MTVGYVRTEVSLQLERWKLIRDCLGGQMAMKKAGEKYLPMPNKDDTSPENQTRYKQYLERAVFYNVTKRTLDGLVGQVFSRDPVAEMPDAMDILKPDIDGSGVALDQQAKKTLASTLGFGRCALLADYPPTSAPATVQDQKEGFVRPTVTLYEPWQVINWRTVTKGARKLFSLVVISEFYTAEDDGFEIRAGMQYRVLRLLPSGVYQVELWRSDAQSGLPDVEQKEKQNFVVAKTYEPKDGKGLPLREIPFTFVGSLNNDPSVDQAPLYDLAVLNVAHYRNSADYEESCFIVGQPTPFFAGLTQQWVDDVMGGKVMLGSRAGIPLPSGGSAGLLQASPNTMPKEAMEAKERQMVALGAKLVEQRQVQRTAAEAKQEAGSESSILGTVSKNVSQAYKQMLTWCALFMGIEPGAEDSKTELCYELNSDFPAARMTAEERAQTMKEWQGGAITFEEMRNQLRVAGVATLDDEAAKDAIESNPPAPGGFGEGGAWAPPDPAKPPTAGPGDPP